MKKRVVVRIERCIACNTCEVVCAREHGGISLIKVLKSRRLAFPIMCKHCDVAPCVMVCYTGALYAEDNTVVFDNNACTRCGLCIIACPFGALFLSLNFTPEKCDSCMELQKIGQKPACVSACPSGALVIDDIDIFSNIKRIRYFKAFKKRAI